MNLFLLFRLSDACSVVFILELIIMILSVRLLLLLLFFSSTVNKFKFEKLQTQDSVK